MGKSIVISVFAFFAAYLTTMSSALAEMTLAMSPATAAGAAGPSVCPSNGLTAGLDVSLWQNVTDWSKIANSSRAFAFIKALQGDNVAKQDPKFPLAWSAAQEAGIMRSAYAFFNPSEDAEQQAEAFITILEISGGPGELPPMLDVEENQGMSAAHVVQGVQTWLDTVETWLRDQQKIAWTPIIYTGPNYWAGLNAPASFARYPLFIADPNHDCPIVPAPWTSWTFWQRKAGAIPGITNATDMDYFSGTGDMLTAFATPSAI